jgi:septation ring formation regulator EzrA
MQPPDPTWASTLLQVIISGATAAAFVAARLYSVLSRLQRAESDIAELNDQAEHSKKSLLDALDRISQDLSQHESDDEKRFDKIQEQYEGLRDILAPMAEAVRWIRSTMEKDIDIANKRITAYDERNRKEMEKLDEVLEKIKDRLNKLENKPPGRRASTK